MTLRLRLTLWYSAVLAGILLVFGLAVYAIMSFSLISPINTNLTDAAHEIIKSSQVIRTGEDSGPAVSLPNLDQFGAARIYVQVWYPPGDSENRGQAAGDRLPSDQPFDADALRGEREVRRAVYVDGLHFFVVTVPMRLRMGDGIIGYVQTASSLEQVDWTKNVLLILLVGGGVAAVILAALVGWLSAHRALQPLETITQTALQLTRADDLSRRIPRTASPHDEVGRLTLAFNESLERLERLFNAQRRFLADVSHELRTPLTVIRGNVDLLRRMGGADLDSLDAIQSETERMSRLVGDLLLLAQAEAGTLPLVTRPVELDTLLLEVYRESQVLAGGVDLSIGDIDQAHVMGDRDRLKQLLLNLVSNALKYTGEGGRVTMGLARVNDWARVVISDTGIGIPPEELAHVFDRFYRVDKARTRSQGGAGLGLAIAQRIAQVHGGRIEAASEGLNGRGSTFAVWLPLCQEKLALESPRKVVEHKTAPSLPVVKKV